MSHYAPPSHEAVSHLSIFPHSDITAWTDGLVPGGLGEGGADFQIKCTGAKCLTAAPLFLARR